MIVVLILTSIVVGLAFSVLTLVQKHMYGIQENFNRNTELHKLEQSLYLDFNRYAEINYDAIKDELTFSSELSVVRYRFEDVQIIKDQDTFPIQLKTKTYYFDGEKTNEGKIDALKLDSKGTRNQFLFVYKQNDATQFMN